jgi:hypothetical protein
MSNKAQKENLEPLLSNLGIGFNIIRFYFVFIILYHIIIIPFLYITHDLFKLQNCHIAVLLAIIYVLLFFIFYAIAKQYAFKFVIKYQIKQFWKIHFSYFNYDDYSNQVNDIYNCAIKEHIAKDKLERYVFDKISKLG